MNFMKSKAGFTLVELIVVIAILGILAGIAIPAYSGYITKANDAADTQVLSAIYTAAVSACATDTNAPATITVTVDAENSGNIKDVKVDSVQLYPAVQNATGTTAEKQSDFALYIGTTIGNGVEFKGETYKNGAIWESSTGKWKAGTTPTPTT